MQLIITDPDVEDLVLEGRGHSGRDEHLDVAFVDDLVLLGWLACHRERAANECRLFLVWLWLSNIAILLGAELERSRAIAAGHPPDAEPYMELRDTSKLRERDGL